MTIWMSVFVCGCIGLAARDVASWFDLDSDSWKWWAVWFTVTLLLNVVYFLLRRATC